MYREQGLSSKTMVSTLTVLPSLINVPNYENLLLLAVLHLNRKKKNKLS